MAKKYQVLARKYRPQRFSDVVGQESILQTLKNGLRRGHLAHAYLFAGSRGTGKTTLARLFAKALNCTAMQADEEPCGSCPSCLDILSGQSLDVIEIDGASNRGIDDIRQINETVGFAPSHGKYKIYVIDEVHMLTKEAFNALLKTLEEPPECVKFFFATTEPHKVLPTILSRCQRFDLSRLSQPQIILKLETIAKDLSRQVEIEALHLLAQYADGSLRDAESLFDQILCFSDATITASDVRNALGLVPQELFFSLDKAFKEQRFEAAFEIVEEVFSSGKDPAHFLGTLIEHYRHIAVVKTRGEAMLGLAPSLSAHYAASAAFYSQPQTLSILDLLLKADAIGSRQLNPRIALELTLLQILRMKNRIPIEALIRRLSDLEEALTQSHIESEEPAQVAPTNDIKATAESPPEPTAELSSQEIAPELDKEPPQNFCEEQDLSEKEMPETKPTEPPSELSIEHSPPPEASDLVEAIESPPPLTPPAVPKAELPPTQPLSQTSQNSSKHPSHYATLMRFAAVELEGTIKN